jgi:hypothetical protein
MNAEFASPVDEQGVLRIRLPTLHPDQVNAFWAAQDRRFFALRCGRRWGKTDFDITLGCDEAIKGGEVGWFAPENKRLIEAYNQIVELLEPVKKSSSKTEGIIRTITGGRIDFWSLEDEDAGRSRKYRLVIIDEGAFTKPTMVDTWNKAIKPTLLDYGGRAIVSSNTNGIDADNFLYQICHDPLLGFSLPGERPPFGFHAPSYNNPHVPKRDKFESEEDYAVRRAADYAKLIADTPPLVYQQEYLAEFVDWSGASFFTRDSLLVNGQPVEFPIRCEAVFAVIDSATKTGTKNDGTGVVYYALTKDTVRPLTIIDWDLQQIEGDLLITWLPTVFQNLDHLAKTCRARMGSVGALIEDKASGMILLQQARRRGMKASAIDSKLTSVGKDERAISVSGYVYQGKVKIARLAYDKVTTYKGTSRNHLLGQVVGFRVGNKDATREDDLLDGFTYGVAIALGNSEGF